jgi:glycosyltransferase involved in cell wall biosynthesis
MGLLTGRPFLFDIRGLWPQERVDGGLWREGSAVHRVWRHLESRLFERAAGVVSLAEGAREHLPGLRAPFRVIPTAVDLERFRPGLPLPPGGEHLGDCTVYLVAGALGTWYLREETLDLLDLALREDPSGHVLLLTEEDPTAFVAGLRRRGVAADRLTVRGVPHREVPCWFSVADTGILLIRSAPSKRASTPTKLGELLACGVPVLITPGIGDTEALVRETGTGIVVERLDRTGYGEALAGLRRLREDSGELRARCRRAAEERLSLVAAVDAYEELYEVLGAPGGAVR